MTLLTDVTKRTRLLVTSSDLTALLEMGARLQPDFASVLLAHSPDPVARASAERPGDEDAVVVLLSNLDRWRPAGPALAPSLPVLMVVARDHPDRPEIAKAGNHIVEPTPIPRLSVLCLRCCSGGPGVSG